MPDESTYDEQGNLIENPGGEEDPRGWVQELRKQAKEGKAAKAEAESALKELSFHKAGIPDDGPGKLFRKAYDGETTEDAIRAAALDYGVIHSGSPGVQEPGPEEQAAVQRAAQATAGASAPPPSSIDEELAETAKLPWQEQAEAVRKVMVRNSIWTDTAQYE